MVLFGFKKFSFSHLWLLWVAAPLNCRCPFSSSWIVFFNCTYCHLSILEVQEIGVAVPGKCLSQYQMVFRLKKKVWG